MSIDDPLLVIRRILDDEGPVLRDLRLRSLTDAPDAFGQRLSDATAVPDADWRQSARSGARGDRRAWFFAIQGGQGGQGVGLVQGRRRPPSTLLLFSLWVDPTLRGRGVGRRLIEALEGWAASWDSTETVLWVHTTNAAALGFYRELAFEETTDGDDAASGKRFGAVAMRRGNASSAPGRQEAGAESAA